MKSNDVGRSDVSHVGATQIPIQSAAALYGASVFDNCRAWRSGRRALVYGLDEHLSRFRTSAELALLDLDVDDGQLVGDVGKAIGSAADDGFLRVRLFAFGTEPELCSRRAAIRIFTLPVAGYAPARPRLMLSAKARPSSGELPRVLKSASAYLQIRREVAMARAGGFDDVLVWNEHHRVSEASRSNVVMVNDDTLVTPPTSEGALPGVTKRLLRTLALADGLRWETRPVELEEIRSADALLLTSSSLGVVAAQSIGDRELSDKGAAEHLCRRYSDLPTANPDAEALTELAL